MEDKENKELIERMAEALREHTVPYKEGSWERFKERDGIPQKRIIPFWYWSSAVAAVVLLGITLFISGNPFADHEDKQQAVTYNSTAITKPGHSDEQDKPLLHPIDSNPAIQESDKELIYKQNQRVGKPDNERLMAFSSQAKQIPAEENSSEAMQRGAEPSAVETKEKKEETLLTETESKPQGNRVNPSAAKGENEALLRMLSEGNSKEQQAFKLAKQDNGPKHWDFGVMVSPALSNERVNMGGGVTVAYRITKKISLGSGVSLVDLGFRQNASSPVSNSSQLAAAPLANTTPMFAARNVETNELTSINTNVLALDIPIDIKYHVTKQFYASAGFSLFAVLNENRTNNYISRIPNVSVNSIQDYALKEPTFQVMSTSEKSPEAPLQGNSYSGFLNFSVGRQMPISKNVGLSVEPFIKLPIGELSRQGTDFKYGGVRVTTSF